MNIIIGFIYIGIAGTIGLFPGIIIGLLLSQLLSLGNSSYDTFLLVCICINFVINLGLIYKFRERLFSKPSVTEQSSHTVIDTLLSIVLLGAIFYPFFVINGEDMSLYLGWGILGPTWIYLFLIITGITSIVRLNSRHTSAERKMVIGLIAATVILWTVIGMVVKRGF